MTSIKRIDDLVTEEVPLESSNVVVHVEIVSGEVSTSTEEVPLIQDRGWGVKYLDGWGSACREVNLSKRES